MDFAGKKVLVMGLGTLGGGVGTARFFAQHGADILVTDLKSEEELHESIIALQEFTAIEFVLGKHREEDFLNADLIIKNPSVASSSPFIELALKNNIEVEIAESLFMKLSPTQNIIGVTGTRGKSTTTQMIYEILKLAGKKVVLGGNVRGTATLELLDTIDQDYYVVLELSSWMLEGFGWEEVSPKTAVITNIYPDHLNRYKGMEEYVQDKKNIYLFQNQGDVLILNKDNEYSQEFSKEAKGKVEWFSSESLPVGVSLSVSGGGKKGYNRENAAAAYKVCSILGIDEQVIKKSLVDFHGLPGRMEHLGFFNGVIVINDTASTTPIAGIKALESIQLGKKIVLIIGGNSKNLPIGELVEAIKKHVYALVYLKGNATDELKKELVDSKIVSAGPFDSIDETVARAFEFAESGDVILFSPSFTSFGQFKNEFERGDHYKTAVARIQKAGS